ncbi:GntR family transcriptional regulator [Methylobacterium sp. J-072]|uniref:GntR family transcriptional regulator n=1 Tax=Methylobacterium sp. J-072 TaxID=2836651 RepID=UPI001FB94BB3|nr:GntR family transcriptional regulator [Methylobacterium sp. J-072]MCJ2095238.1 GntR family transcriptional regulator [Methylobacterium sp. J-072]
MDRESFTLHDVSTFPIVRLRNEAASSPGHAPTWCAEMDRLLASQTPFALIYPARRTDEPHDDRVARGLWLKRNKAALAARCRALIVVEPDPDRRQALEAAFPSLIRAFGTPQAACATDRDAVSLARQVLGAEG